MEPVDRKELFVDVMQNGIIVRNVEEKYSLFYFNFFLY